MGSWVLWSAWGAAIFVIMTIAIALLRRDRARLRAAEAKAVAALGQREDVAGRLVAAEERATRTAEELARDHAQAEELVAQRDATLTETRGALGDALARAEALENERRLALSRAEALENERRVLEEAVAKERSARDALEAKRRALEAEMARQAAAAAEQAAARDAALRAEAKAAAAELRARIEELEAAGREAEERALAAASRAESHAASAAVASEAREAAERARDEALESARVERTAREAFMGEVRLLREQLQKKEAEAARPEAPRSAARPAPVEIVHVGTWWCTQCNRGGVRPEVCHVPKKETVR